MAQEENFQSKRKSKPEFKAFAGKEKSMKKHKKIISLLLALVMVCSFMAMSASAATTEVQPRGTCPNCINGYVETHTEIEGHYTDYPSHLTTCPAVQVAHLHYYNVVFNIYAKCRNCGLDEKTYTYTGVHCPFGG